LLVRVLALLTLVLAGCMPDIGPDTFAGEAVERTDDELARALAKELESAGDGDFSGSVGVARGGQVIFVDGVGTCDGDNGITCGADTVFDIGSVTKGMTGAAIVALEAEGRLSFDDKLVDYFSSLGSRKRDITLHHLLTHTSGFKASVGRDYARATWTKFQRRSKYTVLRSDPGKKYRYSNVGYSYLGKIVERVTGGTYEEYLHDRFFADAGMEWTGYVIPNWEEADVAAGYNLCNDHHRWGTPLDRRWANDGPYWNLRANGGILSSASDMLLWHIALRDGALPEESLETMLSPHVDEGYGDTFYGYGWVTMETDVGTVHWHDGGNGKFYANVFWLRDLDTFVVSLTNAKSADRIQTTLDMARVAAGLE
jgi:CubicO group peptidase (beta-lactamase class C family)